MSAPNRSAEVAAIVDRHRELLTGDDGRRELLIVICRALNVQDGGEWGRLIKHDRGDAIPADIIVWKPTLDHFDVLTDTGPTWIERGLIQPQWAWLAIPDGENPPPPPVDPPVPDDALLKRLTALETTVDRHVAALANLERALIEDRARLSELENKPAPEVQWPALIAKGPTSRVWGHAHEIQLEVVRGEIKK